jgi:Mg2+ and Co2+ transporter CorA
LDNAEKREEEINEEQRKLAERLEKNEKSSLRLLSQFMDRVFLQYQQITQEYEKEIQQYRRSVDSSKCWLR